MAYITFELEDGTTVNIETVDGHRNSPGLIPSGREEETGKLAISFEKQIDGARKLAASMMKNFREGFSDNPSDIDISFGLKASGEVGGFLVSRAGPEATFSVSLHWRDRSGDKDKDKDKEKKSE